MTSRGQPAPRYHVLSQRHCGRDCFVLPCLYKALNVSCNLASVGACQSNLAQEEQLGLGLRQFLTMGFVRGRCGGKSFVVVFGILVFRSILSVWFTPGINRHLIIRLQRPLLIGFHFWTRYKSIRSSPLAAAVHSFTELVHAKSCCTCSLMMFVQLFAYFFNKQYTCDLSTVPYDPSEHFVAEKTFLETAQSGHRWNDGQNCHTSFSLTTSTRRRWLNAHS